ncbi:MAG: LysM peptidoglycan-binding domain-containing protein [Methylococcales bacterium]
MNSQVSKTVTTQNILLSVLTVINVMLILLVIYFFLSSDEPSESTGSAKTSTQKINKKSTSVPIVAYSDEAAKQIAESVRGIDKNKVTNINGKLADNKAAISKVNKKGTDSKVLQQDNISNSLETINKSLDDLGELSSKDASYVATLDALKKEVSSQINRIKPTIKEVTASKVKLGKAQQDGAEKSVDYFNKVDVSKVKTQLAITSARYRLKAQIAQIVSEPEDADLNKKKGIKKADKDYLKTLETESIERANEMRTIQVVTGDSLWDIAERAYGDGYQYPRIFAANPNLTDPDKIEVGTFLRVPL